MQPNQEFKARGRIAHEGHKSKVGTAWKSSSVQVFVPDSMTGSNKIFDMPRGNVECKKCHEVIRYDTRGYAFCQCGDIYNDSHNDSKNIVNHRGYGKFIGQFCRASL